jgi:hypothetical protein
VRPQEAREQERRDREVLGARPDGYLGGFHLEPIKPQQAGRPARARRRA